MFAADAVRCKQRITGGGGGSLLQWSDVDKSIDIVLSDNNTVATKTLSQTSKSGCGADESFAVSSGKKYTEFYIQSAATINLSCGFSPIGYLRDYDLGQFANGYGYYRRGWLYFSGGVTAAHPVYAAGDTISMAVDFDNGTIEFFKNGVSIGQTSRSIAPAQYVPAMSAGGVGDAVKIQSAPDHLYSPPDGFEHW